MQVTKTAYQAKVYPYGGFSVTKAKETGTLVPSIYADYRRIETTSLVSHEDGRQGFKLGFHTEFKYPSDLGLSDVPNSHKQRARRGLKGFSSHNKHRVKSAAYLLQETYGKDVLTFLTCTLPDRFANADAETLSEVIRLFCQSLKRRLKRAGVWSGIIGVAEIQEERFDNSGVCGIHWHLVFRGRPRYGTWSISANEYRELWRNCLSSAYHVDVPIGECSSAIDVQRVQKSAYRYLGKYLSKGCAVIGKVINALGERVIPTSWLVCSHELKRWVDRSIIRLRSEEALTLMDVAGDAESGLCSYGEHLYHEFPDGGKCWIAFYGTLTQKGVTFATLLGSDHG